MSERKVLNKYYPPDFDPSKIPRMKLPKNRQYTVRLMAPFNMRCATCGEYIYRGKKFNARKEDVEGDDYCGIRIYRFYIKCTRCLQEISFKTDPRNTDYEIEAGATRNFMALKLAQEQEKREEEELKEEEANNPMKLLENRTQQSKIEIELMECLEEIKDLNRRHYNIDFNELLKKYNTDEVKEKLLQMQKEKDEKLAKELIAKKRKKDEKITDEDVDDSKKQKVVEEIIEESFSEDDEAINDFEFSKNDLPSFQQTSLEKLERTSDEIKPKKDDTKMATNSGFGMSNNFASHKSTLEKLKFLNNLKKPNKNTNSMANTSSESSKKSGIIDDKPKGNALMSLCSYSDSDNSD